MLDPEIYWTAGFLEGEGSFAMNRRPARNPDPFVKAVQAERECLDRLQLLYGGSINKDRRLRDASSARRPLFEWRLTGRRAIDLMLILEPLMSEKRRNQIRAVLDEVAVLGLKLRERKAQQYAKGTHALSEKSVDVKLTRAAHRAHRMTEPWPYDPDLARDMERGK